MRNHIEMKRKGTFTAYIKAMAHIQGKEIMPEVKLYKPRKPRAQETAPRNLVEKQLRKDAIAWFKKHGWRYWRIENSIAGKSSGLADFLVAKHKMVFVELKGTGDLTGLQPEFRDYCQRCSMPYVVVRAVEDLDMLKFI